MVFLGSPRTTRTKNGDFKSQELWLTTKGGWSKQNTNTNVDIPAGEDEANSAMEVLLSKLGFNDKEDGATTGSSSGSVQSGNSQSGAMDLAAENQMRLMEAQAKNLEADTKKKEVEACVLYIELRYYLFLQKERKMGILTSMAVGIGDKVIDETM